MNHEGIFVGNDGGLPQEEGRMLFPRRTQPYFTESKHIRNPTDRLQVEKINNPV